MMPHDPSLVILPSVPSSAPATVRDPVCGMMVASDSKHRATHAGTEFVFCCAGCRAKFEADPERYLRAQSAPDAHSAVAQSPPASASAAIEYTCPMHPEIVRDRPGSCPICGMALEPRTITAEEIENPELIDMSRRFWTGVALSAPVVLLAMGDLIPGRPLEHLGSPRFL